MKDLLTDRSLGGNSGASRRFIVAMRILAALAAFGMTILIPIMIARQAWEFVAISFVLVLVWTAYLYWFRNNEKALLLPLSLLLCLFVMAAFAENLLFIERLFRFQISNELKLSPRLMQYLAEHATFRRESFEQFGTDPLFFRRKPGSLARSLYNDDPHQEYVAVADEAGFLNNDPHFLSDHTAIDVAIAGDSIIQGVGSPGVIEDIRSLVPFTLFNLSTSSYSPRQKTEALEIFGIPRHAKWLVVEFCAGNDASEIIEDDICERLNRNYLCRFDLESMAAGLGKDPDYRSLGKFGVESPFMQLVREIRSDSLILALGEQLALPFRGFIGGLLGRTPPGNIDIGRFGGGRITEPGNSHFDVTDEQTWIGIGLRLTTKAYDRLIADAKNAGIGVAILYNPTSYEIYHDLLPESLIRSDADSVSTFQRDSLQRYAADKDVPFCDLTQEFRERVAKGTRGLFRSQDGVHWSNTGQKVAAQIIGNCLQSLWGTH